MCYEAYGMFKEKMKSVAKEAHECKVCGQPFDDADDLFDHYDHYHNKGLD